MANPEQRVSCDVCLHGLASCLHDHTDDDNHKHTDEALNAAPDVDYFGKGKSGTAPEDGGHDADTGKKPMPRER